ncbi:hypothetical protein [Raoultibacter phocaeensis]|uniref:hypothetical protein n=1 Tax=Raoultibacter phocaeensis TaxID=2479841 RepID=UPI00111820F1|nr:hypothetical protein [Raoultibacter phocaeensis]
MISTKKIVNTPVKVDFHIHSAASAHKDGEKVKDGTADNTSVLFSMLEENQVNMAAITDHDIFDYSVYKALRAKTKNAVHLHRVLPGVEFTVSFKTDRGDRPVHIVTLFDDTKQELVQSIANAIPLKNGKPDYDMSNAFSEDKYWGIIRAIGLDIVAIAHQKASPGSDRKRKNDANSVGDALFNEFLFVEYFEAYEYKNRRNELFNKNYAYSTDQLEQLRFITGSDCHTWSSYPAYDASSDPDLPYSYLKCLPTFKGLAMAVTDVSRIRTVPSFFSGSTTTLDAIELTLNGADVSIPLSPGINAIIGDNSIGKSSLLNAINGYREIGATVQKGQSRYLEESGLVLKTTIPEDYLLQFDGQDAIRKSFEGLSVGKAKKQLEKHFPDPVNPDSFKSFAMNQFKKFHAALRKSCKYQESLAALGVFKLPEQPPLGAPQSITFDKSVKLDDVSCHNGLVNDVKNARIQLGGVIELHEEAILKEDEPDFEAAIAALDRIVKRHQTIVDEITLEARVANKVIEAITTRENEQDKVITDAQKAQAEFLRAIDRAGSSLANAVMNEQRLLNFSFDFKPLEITPNTNPVGDLQFVCKLGIDEITPGLLSELIDGLIGKRKDLDTLTSSYESVKDAINNYPENEDDPLVALEAKFEVALDAKLKAVKTINREDDDVFDELSRGYNAQMYFKLMADRNVGDGIYIVDQPEDQISQRAIKQTVLKEFRDIAGARQVILITHNPQFVVNLDVDNVIFVGKKDGKLFLRSGALEYECSEYGILETVAENIEGGLETIQRRMKRYEKAS